MTLYQTYPDLSTSTLPWLIVYTLAFLFCKDLQSNDLIDGKTRTKNRKKFTKVIRSRQKLQLKVPWRNKRKELPLLAHLMSMIWERARPTLTSVVLVPGVGGGTMNRWYVGSAATRLQSASSLLSAQSLMLSHRAVIEMQTPPRHVNCRGLFNFIPIL